jgi:hypothetical protein
MSAPPHSLEPPPPGSREDFFTSRNNFLFLVLGLISTAETVLSIAPNWVKAAKPLPRENEDVEAPPADPRLWR